MDAAFDVFAREGYARTTMERIAEQAGVAKGTLYWNFKGKEGLLFAVIDREYDKWGVFAQNIMQADNPSVEALEKSFDLHAWMDSDLQRFTRLMLSLWTDVSSGVRKKIEERIVTAYEGYRTLITGVLDNISGGESMPGVSNRTVASVLIAIVDGLLLQWSADPESVDLAEAGKAMTEMIIRKIEEK